MMMMMMMMFPLDLFLINNNYVNFYTDRSPADQS